MSQTTVLALQGLTCMNCAQRVKKALESREDVEQAEVNVHYAKVTGEAPSQALIDSVVAAGYQAAVAQQPDTELHALRCQHPQSAGSGAGGDCRRRQYRQRQGLR